MIKQKKKKPLGIRRKSRGKRRSAERGGTRGGGLLSTGHMSEGIRRKWSWVERWEENSEKLIRELGIKQWLVSSIMLHLQCKVQYGGSGSLLILFEKGKERRAFVIVLTGHWANYTGPAHNTCMYTLWETVPSTVSSSSFQVCNKQPVSFSSVPQRQLHQQPPHLRRKKVHCMQWCAQCLTYSHSSTFAWVSSTFVCLLQASILRFIILTYCTVNAVPDVPNKNNSIAFVQLEEKV